MIHAAHSFVAGSAVALRQAAEMNESCTRLIQNILVARTGQPPEAVSSWLAAETYLNAEQALQAGLIDEILDNAPGDPPPPA